VPPCRDGAFAAAVAGTTRCAVPLAAPVNGHVLPGRRLRSACGSPALPGRRLRSRRGGYDPAGRAPCSACGRSVLPRAA
ncbi:MAG: hypothetical protein QME96_05650, partial [Myxococcota bacterium]|nr:hypothetical protein [Myxococcota bacterium]